MNYASLNPNDRSLFESIIKKNIVYNPQYNLEQFPERYINPISHSMKGGVRLQEYITSSGNAHFPSIEQIEDNDLGGAYGRSNYNHEIIGGLRKPRRNSIGILKERVPTGLVNQIDMNYLGSADYHGGAIRRPRLTNAIKQKILEMHPELQQIHLQGGKINFKKIFENMKKGLSFVSKAAPIISSIAPEEYRDTINKTGDISGKISNIGSGSCGGNRTTDFFKNLPKNYMKGQKELLKVGSKVLPVASIFVPELAPVAAAVGIANKALGGRMTRKRAKSIGHSRNQARGALVRQYMRENGMTLPQASSYIKQNNIPF